MKSNAELIGASPEEAMRDSSADMVFYYTRKSLIILLVSHVIITELLVILVDLGDHSSMLEASILGHVELLEGGELRSCWMTICNKLVGPRRPINFCHAGLGDRCRMGTFWLDRSW